LLALRQTGRMSHRLSDRKVEALQRAAREAQERRERPAKLRAEREAKLAVAVFNVRARSKFPTPLTWPTFRAALTAKRHYLVVWCPACQNVACVDIRPEKLRYHPDASINCLIPIYLASAVAPTHRLRRSSDCGGDRSARLQQQKVKRT